MSITADGAIMRKYAFTLNHCIYCALTLSIGGVASAAEIAQEEAAPLPALEVPVYPRPDKAPRLDSGPATIDSFHDSYIVMPDGSVLSLAQWVLQGNQGSVLDGPVTRGKMSRLLGEGARSIAGLGPVRGLTQPLPAPYAVIPRSAPQEKGLKSQLTQAAKALASLFGGAWGDKPFGPQSPPPPPRRADGGGIIAGPYEDAVGGHLADQRSATLPRDVSKP